MGQESTESEDLALSTQVLALSWLRSSEMAVPKSVEG